MRVYLETDMEGVAGVLNFHEWTEPGQPYYEQAKEFLTLEINAAIDGFLEGGATYILVHDGHGFGGINVALLDPRVEYVRGSPDKGYPGNLDSSFDYIAWVGQHAKAGTPYGHLAHTQWIDHLDETINDISIGEFGETAGCASELGVRAIFGSGDVAFTREAQELISGIETVAVKEGVKSGTGEDLDEEAYSRYVGSARHLHPERARRLIRAGALRAMGRARTEDFGIAPFKPPYRRVIKLRPGRGRPKPTMAVMEHATSFIGVMNIRSEFKPIGEHAATAKKTKRAETKRAKT
jgi:D-amino peptidase